MEIGYLSEGASCSGGALLDAKDIDLRSGGIDEHVAAELRARFAAIAADWELPEMRIYDRYPEV